MGEILLFIGIVMIVYGCALSIASSVERLEEKVDEVLKKMEGR